MSLLAMLVICSAVAVPFILIYLFKGLLSLYFRDRPIRQMLLFGFTCGFSVIVARRSLEPGDTFVTFLIAVACCVPVMLAMCILVWLFLKHVGIAGDEGFLAEFMRAYRGH